MSAALPRTAAARAGTRPLILRVALRHFADYGYDGTSLNDIADAVGIRRPSLLHHFPSKEALYHAVVVDSLADWVALVDAATQQPESGWPRVESLLEAAFTFFEDHPEFVRLTRREAIQGGPILSDELARVLRPLFRRAVGFLEREMDAGRLRRHDASNLLLTGYGAMLSYFSDAPMISALIGRDPLSKATLRARRQHIMDFFRSALEP